MSLFAIRSFMAENSLEKRWNAKWKERRGQRGVGGIFYCLAHREHENILLCFPAHLILDPGSLGWCILLWIFVQQDKSFSDSEIDITNFPVNLSDWRRSCQRRGAHFEDVESDIGRVWTLSYRASLHQIALIYVCQRRCNVERFGKNYCFLSIKESSWHG